MAMRTSVDPTTSMVLAGSRWAAREQRFTNERARGLVLIARVWICCGVDPAPEPQGQSSDGPDGDDGVAPRERRTAHERSSRRRHPQTLRRDSRRFDGKCIHPGRSQAADLPLPRITELMKERGGAERSRSRPRRGNSHSISSQRRQSASRRKSHGGTRTAPSEELRVRPSRMRVPPRWKRKPGGRGRCSETGRGSIYERRVGRRRLPSRRAVTGRR